MLTVFSFCSYCVIRLPVCNRRKTAARGANPDPNSQPQLPRYRNGHPFSSVAVLISSLWRPNTLYPTPATDKRIPTHTYTHTHMQISIFLSLSLFSLVRSTIIHQESHVQLTPCPAHDGDTRRRISMSTSSDYGTGAPPASAVAAVADLCHIPVHHTQAPSKQADPPAPIKEEPAGPEEVVDSITPATEGELNYGSYLQLDRLLSSQTLQSRGPDGNPVHDEHLFIVIHQAYELWFKQILFELDSVLDVFKAGFVDEAKMRLLAARLQRINVIMNLLVDQISVLDTMTPRDFFSFRSFLGTASGFQSVQFRILENKIGVKKSLRIRYHSDDYKAALSGPDLKAVQDSEEQPSLFAMIESWLARTPGLKDGDFDFWTQFQANLHESWRAAWQRIEAEPNAHLQESMRAAQKETEAQFERIFDEDVHANELLKGNRRFSYPAFKALFFISFYRDFPRFHLAYDVLNQLEVLDKHLQKWRLNHVNLVQRMLGTKAGSGGSSGYHYLRSTLSDRYKVFLDLYNLSTYLVDDDCIPALPPHVKKLLNVPPES
ncbi:uncharacterized protein MONBRDRAFT_33737 [Monosiga brevicollis MX1]|uniref:Tryptophan 2,3-dioxygenase n=1 Tax=Monosiga brevicollis TaxID=81824 RepID=A9V766_MONBE|nr:uncharacterized protein MONBRDRAFT_33737 [Monosiga brevicollis MX1]EDQ86737.1 predicted protein [Monosiga brevicollis MX1]|eukprot:XP_001748573.1 hypothetical protein [Monosiga brevicollis MX1]